MLYASGLPDNQRDDGIGRILLRPEKSARLDQVRF